MTTEKTNKPSGTITQLRIKNFKCFRDVVVPLRPLTIIYGQNSSGKSTIFQAIDLMRLACKLLEEKKEESQGGSSFDHRRMLQKTPWYTEWKELLHDSEQQSIHVGLSIVSPALSDKTPAPVQAVDFELNEDWHVSGRGGKLPKSVRMRYWVDEEERGDTPDIDITMKSRVSQKSGGRNRQYAEATVRTKWLSKNGYAVDEDASAQTKTLSLGECRFYMNLEVKKDPVAKKLNEEIQRTWKDLKSILRPEELFNPDHPDTVHIGAGEDYWVRERFRGEGSRLIPELRRDVASIFTDSAGSGPRARALSVTDRRESLGSMGKELLESLNQALDALGIPHSVMAEKGFLDNRRKSSVSEISPFNVGHGIQYYTPRLMLSIHARDQLVCIEEPEAHVHPGLQAELGAYFLKHIEEGGGQRLVESHSENMMIKIQHQINRRGRKSAAEARKLASQVHAVYVNNDGEGESSVTRIQVDENGDFMDYWPKGFFPERNHMYF